LMRPHLSGWEVCKRIRARASTPIIMLTAKSDPSDVIKGLRLGADDYVKKPFHPAELHARVEAVLRRYRSSSAATKTGHRLQFDARKLVIDIPERCVTVDGKQISLTSREFDLLVFLARHPGVILTTDKIFGQVWSYDSEADIDNVKWYIWRLRQKIEPNSKDPKTIITERGIGYRFVTE
ncbi:MAG: winged helix-turn-helix domain-containing protein, partial [Anaerolineae bacterium]